MPGSLSPSRFTTERPAAFPGAETIFYDPATGEISIYGGQGNAVDLYVFAKLPAYLDLTAANFTVVGP